VPIGITSGESLKKESSFDMDKDADKRSVGKVYTRCSLIRLKKIHSQPSNPSMIPSIWRVRNTNRLPPEIEQDFS